MFVGNRAAIGAVLLVAVFWGSANSHDVSCSNVNLTETEIGGQSIFFSEPSKPVRYASQTQLRLNSRSWSQASSLCAQCLNSGLADISTRVWIGRYNSGELVERLVWLTGPSPSIYVSPNEMTLRAFACNAPVAPFPPTAGPRLIDPNLGVRVLAGNFTTPIGLAYFNPNQFIVLEKNTGKVFLMTTTNTSQTNRTILDLAVNSASERGLLSVALHPEFPTNPGVYFYWTISSTGSDTNNVSEVPLLGNRVDRFVWDGTNLTFDQNLIQIRAFQADPGQPIRGNHNGGPIRFGPDGKLYIIIGDVGRRGNMQNLVNGWSGIPGIPDDQFGGPEPDDAHLTGVVLRLNPDGSSPTDNPFFSTGAAIGGEVGENIQKLFAYGIRNSFGLVFDEISGRLWESENSDDAFDELNQINPGHNGGWIQFMGFSDYIAIWKSIELMLPPSGNVPGAELQQIRYPPTNISNTPAEAFQKLFVLPGSHYEDPKFSWRYAISPAGMGFLYSNALGMQYNGNLFVGAAINLGYLFRFRLNADRSDLILDDPRVTDRVADNLEKFDLTQSEPFFFGFNFGIVTQILTAPNGNLVLVGLSDGVIYEIFRNTTSA